MPDVNVTPVSLKCKICGGDIVNNYLAGSCVCAHCGNKWSLEDMIPDYGKYSNVITKINRANDLLENNPNLSATEQARIQYQTAMVECENYSSDVIGSDLLKACKDGMEKTEKLRIYLKGKKFFDNKSYESALEEFKKIPGFRDVDEISEQCTVLVEKGKKTPIPLAVIFALIIPAILAIVLKEKVGMPLPAVIPIFLACSAGLGFVVYRGGVWSTVIKVASFLSAGPLILFMILAYGFHVPVVPSAIVAIGTPVVLLVLFGILAERKS